MTTVANTRIAVKFIKAAGGNAPLYYNQEDVKGHSGPLLNLASVNAGNSQDLYVGGGGINSGFEIALKAAKQDTSQYQELHQALFDKAKGDASRAASAQYDSEDPMTFSYCQSNLVAKRSGWYEGACFVDVFAPARRPGGISQNVAMLYAAPPYGDKTQYPTDADFVNAIGNTAGNIVATVAAYNAIAPQQKLPAIEALRLCAFSSGIYNPNDRLSLNVVARAIYAGLAKALQSQASGLQEIHLPIEAPLFYAVKEDLDAGAAAVAAAV